MATSFTLALDGVAATEALARTLASLARTGDVIALSGGLGAGKSVFARAFVRTFTGEAEEVPSPTFTLVQTYEGAGQRLYHFDLYRLEQPEEAFELGIEDAFADGISLIEWPERLGRLLPAESLRLTLTFAGAPEARLIEIAAGGSWPARLHEAGLAP